MRRANVKDVRSFQFSGRTGKSGEKMDAKARVALFDRRIKHLRKARGLSQDALARALGYGSRGSIANIESGRQEPPLSIALALADFFGVRLEGLTAEEPGEPPDPAIIAVRAFLAGLPPRKRQTAVDKLLPALKELAEDGSAQETSVTLDAHAEAEDISDDQ
jgi:transcriptional regulator with XRE-family HTH domain